MRGAPGKRRDILSMGIYFSGSSNCKVEKQTLFLRLALADQELNMTPG